jgi:hypothetical protein
VGEAISAVAASTSDEQASEPGFPDDQFAAGVELVRANLPAPVPTTSPSAHWRTANEEADRPQQERHDQYVPKYVYGKTQPAQQGQDEHKSN